MDTETITLEGKSCKPFSKLKEAFAGLGFTSVEARKDKLVLEKTETEDLEGKPHHFYRAVFQPEKLSFTYSIGANRAVRRLEALSALLNMLKLAEDSYSVEASQLHAPLEAALREVLSLSDAASYSSAEQLAELQDRYSSLEKKYKDLVVSSEQNARILLECEKKRDEYHGRIRQLEGMSDQVLRQEIFKWLKTHAGEISVSEFSKSYSVPTSRVEEGLEQLLKSGYIRKKG